MRPYLLAPIIVLSGLCGVASAQESDRYALEQTADGYVRLDKQTGQMSICTESEGQLTCKHAADDRDAYASEVDRLRTQVTQLEQRVAALEQTPKSQALPSDEEIDRTMSVMQRFMRSFFGMVKEFDNDMKDEDQSAPGQKT